MEREVILGEMKRTAEENGGQPLGKGRFERATGIGEYDWLKYWSRFGDLQREAGFEPNRLKAAYDDAYLFEKLIALTREQQRFPTERERKTRARNDYGFPSAGVFRRLGNREQLIARLIAYCEGRLEHSDVVELLKPLVAASSSDSPGHIESNDERASYGFVYLVKGHPGEYKIGRTKLVDRRLSELGATASIEHELVHEIKTDDPSGVEAYWHKRFATKRMRGEWFRLSPTDVKAFRRWRRIY
jgi:Meiotically up-regulated gene 113